jgi:hypothetical protein
MASAIAKPIETTIPRTLEFISPPPPLRLSGFT